MIHGCEIVFLKFIDEDRKIVIGDFYGDQEIEFISSDENYHVVDCGLIIYYLNEPFIEFRVNNSITKSSRS